MAIYLDHAATTPVDPKVKEAMLPFLMEEFGNPSSIHFFGRKVRQAIDQARDQIARALSADPSQIVFTSGGTEADNLAVIGVAEAQREKGKKHVITSQIEHHAVLDACKHLEKRGFEVTYLPVDRYGMISVDELRKAIRKDTALISIMYGNNEVGTIQPIAQIGELAREHGILFHTDAVQAFGTEELNVQTLPVDLVTISSHKINGPKGVGALYIGKQVRLFPRQFGGNQERRRRAGTENVPGIVGFAKAVELALARKEQVRKHLLMLKETFVNALKEQGIEFVINGHPVHSLPHICNVSFPGTDSETLLMNLDLEQIACSSGSACTSGTLTISHVVKAMTDDLSIARSAIRFSFGKENTREEVIYAAQKVGEIVKRLVS